MKKPHKAILGLLIGILSLLTLVTYRYNLTFGDTVYDKSLMAGCMYKLLQSENYTQSKIKCECFVKPLTEKYSEEEIRNNIDKIFLENKNLLDKCLTKNEKYIPEKTINFAIFFPDTVQKGSLIEGWIEFNSEMDTLEIKQDQWRITNFYALTRSDSNFGDYTLLKKQILDTFTAVSNNKIPIAIKFNRLGLNYVDGVLEDIILVPTSDSSEVRMISLEARITFQSFVMDSINN